jgi:hypothetical protein
MLQASDSTYLHASYFISLQINPMRLIHPPIWLVMLSPTYFIPGSASCPWPAMICFLFVFPTLLVRHPMFISRAIEAFICIIISDYIFYRVAGGGGGGGYNLFKIFSFTPVLFLVAALMKTFV